MIVSLVSFARRPTPLCFGAELVVVPTEVRIAGQGGGAGAGWGVGPCVVMTVVLSVTATRLVGLVTVFEVSYFFKEFVEAFSKGFQGRGDGLDVGRVGGGGTVRGRWGNFHDAVS